MSDISTEQSNVALLDGLNQEQIEAVSTVDGPLLIIAGPGSGKTRVLTSRIAYLIEQHRVAPWNILALTFTNKAAREMKERVEGFVGDRARWITMGTFHSFSARILRQYGQEIGVNPRFVIYDSTDQQGVIKAAMQALDISTKQFSPRAVLAAISSAKSRDIGPGEYARQVETYWQEVVSRIYPNYQETLTRRSALDFDDLLSAALRLIRESEIARNELRKRFQYVLVDEYQDTNRLQYLIVNELSQEHRNVCVVGDPDQSIYGWRAADIRNILTFKDDFPEAVEIHLEENYRSTPEILTAADGVIRENSQRIERILRTSRIQGTPITVRECMNEQYEARFIVDEIMRLLRDGYTGGEFAVLYRTNAQSRGIEEMFIRAGIPYQLIGGTRFYERREIKDVIALMRLLANPDDLAAFERVVGAFPAGQGIGAKTLATLEEWSRRHGRGLHEALYAVGQTGGPSFGGRAQSLVVQLRDVLQDLRDLEPAISLTELFDRALEETGYTSLFSEADPETIERWENVLQLRGTIEQYDDLDPDARLTTFLEEVALVSDADTVIDDEERVTLITLHAVKGLEFKVVFITGAEDGLIPHQRSITEDPSMLEEERRLFYVGITRAQDHLYITYTFRRNRFGSSDLATPSPFLTAIPESVCGDIPTREPPRKERLAATPSADVAVEETQPYVPGQRVFHARFGDGVIHDVVDKRGDQEVVVDFKRHGQKRLIASLANLTLE